MSVSQQDIMHEAQQCLLARGLDPEQFYVRFSFPSETEKHCPGCDYVTVIVVGRTQTADVRKHPVVRADFYLTRKHWRERILTPLFNNLLGSNHKEAVDHPAHYGGADNPYEVIKVLEHWLTREEFIGALKFNIHKYSARARLKNQAEDYAKGAWYANYLVEFMKRVP